MNKRIRHVMLALFGLSLTISISGALFISALILIDWVYRRPVWRSSPLDIPLFMLFLWTVVTTMFHGSAGFRDAVSSQSAILLFYWAAHGAEEGDIPVVLRWFCVGAALGGLLGVLQVLSGIIYRPSQRIHETPEFFSGWPKVLIHRLAVNNDRAVGWRSHPLTYAETFIPAVFLICKAMVEALKRVPQNWSKFAGAFTGLVATLLGILFAQGRGVWLGVIVGFGVFAVMQGKKFFIRFSLLSLIVLSCVLAASPGMRGRFLSIVSATHGTAGDQASKQTRYELWKATLGQFKSNPLTGVGFKGLKVPLYDPVDKTMRMWTEAHNMFLQSAVEVGIIGAGVFLWILVICFKFVWESPAHYKPAMCAMFAAFLAAGLTESWPRDKEIAMIFWLMMGAACFLGKEERADA